VEDFFFFFSFFERGTASDLSDLQNAKGLLPLGWESA
jgi:hypothetical protein